MLCPKCGRQVIPELKKCNYCQYDFIKAFNKYKKWELRTHKKIRKYRINHDLYQHNERIKITENLFEITETDDFKQKLLKYDISDEEWNIMQFQLVSDIYLNKIRKNKLNANINKLLDSYQHEYKYKLKILTKNFVNLIRLAGVNPFSKYYVYTLNSYNLSIIEGLEVLGCVIKDLLYGEIKYEDLDVKIKYFMNLKKNDSKRIEYEENLAKSIDEYFILTGRTYFSPSFEDKLIKYNLSIKNGYHIKERLLKEIYLKDLFKNIDLKLDYFIKEEHYNIKQRELKKKSHVYSEKSVFSKENDILNDIELIGDAYTYYDVVELKKNPNKAKLAKRKKRKEKNVSSPINNQLGSDEYSYDDMIEIEKECLGDFDNNYYE